MAFFMLSFGSFLAFLVVFCLLGGHSLFFCALPLFFLPLFSSDGVNICDFFGCRSSFFAVYACFLWISDAFSWFFYGKGENRRKNRWNFGEFVLFFAFSLSSLGFLAYFLGVFRLFSLIFERSGCCRVYFAPFSLFFWRKYRLFYLFFLFFDFWFSAEQQKTAIFKRNNDEKRNIWKIVPVFLFFVFCSGYFYMNFCVFCENRV